MHDSALLAGGLGEDVFVVERVEVAGRPGKAHQHLSGGYLGQWRYLGSRFNGLPEQVMWHVYSFLSLRCGPRLSGLGQRDYGLAGLARLLPVLIHVAAFNYEECHAASSGPTPT